MEMNKIKELHLILDEEESITDTVFCTYCNTEEAMLTHDIVFTTQFPFLSFRYAKRLFVHYKERSHEITLGECEGTNRIIKEGHNLEKMLLSGEFNYF